DVPTRTAWTGSSSNSTPHNLHLSFITASMGHGNRTGQASGLSVVFVPPTPWAAVVYMGCLRTWRRKNGVFVLSRHLPLLPCDASLSPRSGFPLDGVVPCSPTRVPRNPASRLSDGNCSM